MRWGMEITLHHLEHSRSHRILWLLEELELPYELKVYKRDKEMRAPASLKDVHPLGKAPVVTIDGAVFAESGAIIEEIVDRAGSLKPDAGTEAFRRYRFFMHYAEGSLMPPLLVRLITSLLQGDKIPWIIRPIAKGIGTKIDANFTNGEIQRHTAFLDAELKSRPFLCGEALTAADIQMSYPVEALLSRGGGPSAPALRAYLDRLQERPAYQTALSKGGAVMIPK